MPARQPPAGPADATAEPAILHATTVALGGRGVLILGAAGSGKSALALQLMAWGAQLVADDRTLVRARGDGLTATAPDTIAGAIEARGIGLLAADPLAEAGLALAVDLDTASPARLPPRATITLLDRLLPCFQKIESARLGPAILQYLKCGWAEL